MCVEEKMRRPNLTWVSMCVIIQCVCAPVTYNVSTFTTDFIRTRVLMHFERSRSHGL
jgi:hypothetical protein